MANPLYGQNKFDDTIDFAGNYLDFCAGYGGNLTGVQAFPFTGDAQITGSLIISGSGTPGLTIEGPIQVNHSGSPSAVFTANSDTAEQVLLYDSKIAIEDSGYELAFLSANAYSARNGILSLANWSDGLVGASINGGPYQSFMRGQLLIGKMGTAANVVNPHTLEVTGSVMITGSLTTSGSVVDFTKATAISGSIFSGSTYYGDGSQLTNLPASDPFPFTGDAQITGSLIVSASATSQSLSVIGSGSTVFNVIGSTGTLFSVDDDLNGMLFTTNDISGLPVLQASASGETFIGKSPQSLYTTAVISATSASSTASLCTLSTSSYDGAFFDYTMTSGSNAKAGNIMSVWNGGTVNYTEVSTTDIGTTSGINFEVIISASTAQLVTVTDSTAPNTWKVKTIIKAI